MNSYVLDFVSSQSSAEAQGAALHACAAAPRGARLETDIPRLTLPPRNKDGKKTVPYTL